MKKRDRVYLVGVIITIASLIGLSKGHLNAGLFSITFTIGFAMVLTGYLR